MLTDLYLLHRRLQLGRCKPATPGIGVTGKPIVRIGCDLAASNRLDNLSRDTYLTNTTDESPSRLNLHWFLFMIVV
jgi:hypothetical protein